MPLTLGHQLGHDQAVVWAVNVKVKTNVEDVAVVDRDQMRRDEAPILIRRCAVRRRLAGVGGGHRLHLVDAGCGEIDPNGAILTEDPVEEVVVVPRAHHHPEHQIPTRPTLYDSAVARVSPGRLTR